MARRIANSTLNATTLDIMNVIRQNASYDYQASVPVVQKATDIPKVGEVIYGTPAFSNQFLNALINRIALVRVSSATFNNPYARLKKGYLEFGETVEEIFVKIANVVDYTPEKGEERELKRTIPDVMSAFHVMNWRVMYPVTIQDEDLRQAFLSMDGVTNLIAKIVDQVYTAAEYDEFLLFKYLLIKKISHGSVYTVAVPTGSDIKEFGVEFRANSNVLTFMKDGYNEAHVLTNTPKSRQVIFMDSLFNAQYDVDVLSAAFNMDKADYIGSLFLIDDWTTFDSKRFETIMANSDGLEAVTAEELTLMNSVKAVLLDENWFQVYDNNNKFTEKYVASGLYWNYFYHTWKTISVSPFSNAVCFVESAAITLPETFIVEVTDKETSEEAVTFTLVPQFENASFTPTNYRFIQTEELTTAGIGVHPYGGFLIPASAINTDFGFDIMINNQVYTVDDSVAGSKALSPVNSVVGDTFTMMIKS